ncbi:MAG: dihydrofolate reductase [Burkholderiales bacterium]|nr:dihydrofolate reductase [Burkholderiales bacterium]
MTADRVPAVELVVAAARNGVIGHRGALPWRLPEDLQRFKALTLGHTIVMGRRTHDSIGRLLPGRASIIVTRDRDRVIEGATVVHSLDAAFAAADPERRLFVIGGGELYAQALAHAARVHLTEVDATPEGDAWFVPLDASRWREVSAEPWHAPPAPDCRFVVLERVAP